MPAGDRTGPRGQGPMTGRAFGNCVGHDSPENKNEFGYYGRGFGFGRGMGRHRGFGRGGYRDWPFTGYNPTPYWIQDREMEIKMLKSQAEELKSIQKAIGERLDALEKESN